MISRTKLAQLISLYKQKEIERERVKYTKKLFGIEFCILRTANSDKN